MGIFKFLNFFSKAKNRNSYYNNRGYGASYGQNRPKLTPVSFFNKLEEKINAFSLDNSFKAKKNITEINRFIGFNNEDEIIASLGNPVVRSAYEDQGMQFSSLKYNYSIFDYNVRLYFFTVDEKVYAALYEFKEVFPQRSQKLELIFKSIFKKYVADATEDVFLQKSTKENIIIADVRNNFIHISSHVLLNIFYVKDAEQLKIILSSVKSTKDKNEREIEAQRLSQLDDKL